MLSVAHFLKRTVALNVILSSNRRFQCKSANRSVILIRNLNTVHYMKQEIAKYFETRMNGCLPQCLWMSESI